MEAVPETQSDSAPPPPSGAAAFSKAALAGFAFSLLGLAFFPVSVFGLVFAAVGLATTRGGKRRGRGIAIVALVLAPLTLLTVPMQLPELRKGVEQFRTQSETLEARVNVKLLVRTVKAAQQKSGQLPAALPLTPSQVPCGSQPQPWPPDAAPGWKALGFAPPEPLRYSYEYVPDADGKSFTVRAHGDLNCDGRSSLFEGRPGQLALHIENEFE